GSPAAGAPHFGRCPPPRRRLRAQNSGPAQPRAAASVLRFSEPATTGPRGPRQSRRTGQAQRAGATAALQPRRRDHLGVQMTASLESPADGVKRMAGRGSPRVPRYQPA
ncbi:unnamed protein product, partial [Ixodes pacificus]